jgi:membrane-anchored protein YejM (alkaline phosphatase superfamily)
LDGKKLVEQIGKAKYQSAYVAQLKAINTKVLSTISTIDAKPHRDTITVIVGDHGPRMNLDWGSAKGTDMDEVKGTLMAVRIPDRYKNTIGDIDKCSPLTLLHRIATKVYGAQIPPVDDFSYYSSLNEPFDFIPIANPTGRKDDPAVKLP